MNLFTMKPGELVCGFRLERTESIPKMNASYAKLIHEKTGAVLYYSDRDDGQLIFSVGFRTLPEDDTGVFHILEHSCLDGSDDFPLKEPFVNLIKTSMAVDLNAMTYPERTIYYYITTNEQDYMNMLRVYLDAVFHPLLLTDRRIFEKEAWHLEPDGNGGVSYSGVVFNEMQGHDNNPDYVMWNTALKQLFKDRYPAYNSGGNPLYIPDLSYEQFCETYRRFYSNDNAIFYLSGRLGLEDELAYIDNILTNRASFGYKKPALVTPQPPVISRAEVQYQLGEKEEEAGNTHLLLSFALPQERGDELSLAFNLLATYLAETTESPLSAAILGADVGQDFSMGCDIDCLQPIVFFSLGKSDPEKADSFAQVTAQTLRDLISKGLDEHRLSALLACHETDSRRAALRVDTGFSLMNAFIREHVMTGDVHPQDSLAMIRKKLAADPKYFEHLIEAFILSSDHHALTVCAPSHHVEAARRQAMKARIDREAEKLNATPNGYGDMAARLEALNAYLVAEDDPEAVAAIPHLSPRSLSVEKALAGRRDLTEDTALISGEAVTSLYYEAKAEGMVLSGLLFDLSVVPAEDLVYVRCLKNALMELPTAGHTVNELSDLWAKLQTNVEWSFLQSITDTQTNGYRQYLQVRIDAPEETLAEAVALLGEQITSVIFDPAILRRLFSNSSAFKNQLIMNGNGTALRMAEASLSAAGAARWEISGVPAYEYLSKLADRFDHHKDELIAGLHRVAQRIFGHVRPLCYCFGSEVAYRTWTQALSVLPLSFGNMPTAEVVPVAPRIHKALSIPGEVNYCCEAFVLSDIGAQFSSRMQVIVSYLYSTYFWDEIRARGGAYGASAVAYPYGILAFVSYRDPRVTDTYEVYRRLADWLEDHLPDDEEIGSLIVSTIGSTYLVPRSPLDEGTTALNRYLRGKTLSDIASDIQNILGTSAQDFSEFVKIIRQLSARDLGLRTAVGGKNAIISSGLFDSVEEL